MQIARLWNPARICNLYTELLSDIPQVFPTLSQQAVDALFDELPAYRAAAHGFVLPVKKTAAAKAILNFWIQNSESLGSWWKVYEMLALMNPSSAGPERVMSVFSNTIADQQQHILNDALECYVLLGYNLRK